MGVLESGRQAAEARMTSRANIRRLTGDSTVVGGYEVPGWSTSMSDVPLRLASVAGAGRMRTVTVGGVTFDEVTAVAHLPADTPLAESDLLEVTSGEWTGTVFRVADAVSADQRTARRVPVVKVTRPEEWT